MEAEINNTVTEQAQNGTNNVTDTVNGAGQSDNQQTAQNEKTYTEKEFQSEVDRRVQQSLNTAREKWQSELETRLKSERDEGARLAKMSADERAKEEQKKAQENFEKERAQYQRERLEYETAKLLNEKELPVTFANILAGKDAEETSANIEAFKKSWDDSIQKAVESRLKGSAPSTGTGGQSESDPFLLGFKKK